MIYNGSEDLLCLTKNEQVNSFFDGAGWMIYKEKVLSQDLKNINKLKLKTLRFGDADLILVHGMTDSFIACPKVSNGSGTIPVKGTKF